MKNTKMRKKMLLSSIAMLMVATVSLGSATFAWFKSNPYADATGIKMQATASKGLKVLSATQAAKNAKMELYNVDTYQSSTVLRTNDGTVSYATPIALNPVSINATDAGFTGYTVGAELDTAYGALGTENVALAENGVENVAANVTGDYYVEDVYAAVVGAADPDATMKVKIKDLTVTTVGLDMSAGVRIALYYEDYQKDINAETPGDQPGYVSKLIGTYNPTAAARANNKITGGEGAAYSSATKVSYSAAPASEAKTWPGDTLDQSGYDRFKVLVYLDGEDSKVFSNNIKPNDLISSIKLDLQVVEN